jgi:hypothetical protein
MTEAQIRKIVREELANAAPIIVQIAQAKAFDARLRRRA